MNYTSDNVIRLGFYYWTANSRTFADTQDTAAAPAVEPRENTAPGRPDEKSTSVYANVDWDLNEQWQISLGGRYTTDKKGIDQIADVTLTQHIAMFARLPGLEQAPLVLSPFGAFIAPNLPFFNFFLPHRDLMGNIIGLGNMETVTTYPENKIGKDKWSEFTPSGKLSFRASENTLLYAGVPGFKSGGFTFTGRPTTRQLRAGNRHTIPWV